MKIMPNKNTQQITVGIDIGSSKICCAIGQVNIENNKEPKHHLSLAWVDL